MLFRSDSADKKTADVKTSKKTDSKKTHSKKQNSENNLVLIPEDIRDSRKWEVRDITYRNPENRYFFSSDYDVKSRVEQTYATSSKILSAKYQYTLYSLVEIFKKEPKPILDDSYFFPFQDQTVAINLGNASCYTFKDNSETDFLPVSSYYECSIGNARILVQGLKMTSHTTNEDVAKGITKDRKSTRLNSSH